MKKSKISNYRSQIKYAGNKSDYDGLQKNIRGLQTPKIEVWENKYPDKDYTVNIETSEFTCICPKTGLPDFASLNIEYSPAGWCLELKSFKEYILFFRDIGIFHEHAVNRVLEDIVRACRPRRVTVTGAFNARGGMKTTVKAEYRSEKRDEGREKREG